MLIDNGELAATLVSTLAPFMPLLVSAGKIGGAKIVEVVAEKGGDAAWDKAQALWRKIEQHGGDDDEVHEAASFLARQPENELRQTTFAQVLGSLLQQNSALATDLYQLLGGQTAVQQVVATRGSWVSHVSQAISGTSAGQQTISADDASTVRDVKQNISRQ